MKALQVSGPAELTALRQLLIAVDFTAPAVCRRLEIPSIYDFRSIRDGRSLATDTCNPLDLLIRLFMDVELVERSEVNGLLGGDGAQLFERLGLLSTWQADERLCHGAVLLYPAESLWIVSDLNASPAGPSETVLAEDAVYPAITRNTRQFLSSLPPTPCDRFLELCAGTGIAALLASGYARHTWAADITERATSFARFNAALNAIENCTPVQGDLYEPVTGQQFDRIVAHPPYMPSLEQKYIFRDGGEDGEQITRRIVAGLPDHLVPGGRFYCTCMLTDRKGAGAEERIRRMLGDRAEEFDVLVVTLQAFQPTEYYFRLALAGRATLDEVVRRHEIFARLEVERLVYCSMVVERHATARASFTCRRQAGPASGVEEVEWLMGWEARVARSDPTDWLLAARPSASARAHLRLSHRMEGGGWVVHECTLATGSPFALEAKCPPWVATLVTRAAGRDTTLDHLDFLKRSGALPPDAAEAEFAKLIRSLVAGGFLEVTEHPLPAARLSPVPAAS